MLRLNFGAILFGLAALVAQVPVATALDAQQLRSSLQSMLAQGPLPFRRSSGGRQNTDVAQELARERGILTGVYASREYRPLWNVDDTPSRQALAVLETLRAAGDYGLRAQDYDAEKIAQELRDLAAGSGADAARRAQVDLALSAATLRFLAHLHYGRVDPRKAGFDTPVMPPTHIDRAAILVQLATAEDTGAVFAAIEPAFRHYRLLKQALSRYRQLATEPQLTNLPPLPARSVALGEIYSGAPALRRLLQRLGDVCAPAAPSMPPAASAPAATLEPSAIAAPLGQDGILDQDFILDAALVSAVKHFQQRHGLRADGAIGKATFAALTTPLSRRVRQIELTLERWRWLPGFETPPIIVNIPQFRLFGLPTTEDTESDMLQMDVIVGQTFKRMRTPIFAADMTYVVFRPYWDVPYNIMSRELLPQIRAEPTILAERDLEIVRGASDNAQSVSPTAENLAALGSGKLRLRQRPGPDNALGLVKFMLPNRYNVYLHSTPAIDLFNETRRAFSHGCIRVSDPVALAGHILRGTPGDWTAEKIIAAMNGSKTQRVNLSRPIRVMILYGTAVATEAGDVYFFEDLYGHDAHLEDLLLTH